MTEAELNEKLNKIESELTGDPDHDIDVLDSWGGRYLEDPDSEPLLREISNRIYDIVIRDDPEEPQRIYEDMAAAADEDFAEACGLISQKRYDEAVSKLALLTESIRIYPLSDDDIWTDFTSHTERMIFQDLFNELIGDRKIRRHPMRPGPILFTYGSLLIQMGKADEALYPLEMLNIFNPVCMKYLFELGEAYKRTGHLEEAFNMGLWGLSCAANRADLARCYRDMAFCLSEAGNHEDSVMLYMLSLHFQASLEAETEIARIRRNFGVSPDGYTLDAIKNRCEEVGIPVGFSEIVRRNIGLLDPSEKP